MFGKYLFEVGMNQNHNFELTSCPLLSAVSVSLASASSLLTVNEMGLQIQC